jgi:hypothetical protein
MGEHASRLKSSGGDAEKKSEALRAKFGLFAIVQERLNARCEALDPGIAQAIASPFPINCCIFRHITAQAIAVEVLQ